MKLLLDSIIEKKNVDDPLYKLEREILEHDKPNVWNIHNQENMERMLEVDFQKFAIAVTQHTNQDLAKLTTFTFYASVEYLKEKYKK